MLAVWTTGRLKFFFYELAQCDRSSVRLHIEVLISHTCLRAVSAWFCGTLSVVSSAHLVEHVALNTELMCLSIQYRAFTVIKPQLPLYWKLIQ